MRVCKVDYWLQFLKPIPIMKRILLSLFLINLFIIGNGQKSKFEYGFQSGLNISSSYGDAFSQVKRGPLTGLHIGGHLKVTKTENWGFKFLVSYDNIGWIYKSLTLESNTSSTGLMNVDISIKLNYLNMPVLAEYSFGNKIKINVDGGFFLGILLNNKVITEVKEPIPPNQEPILESSSIARKGTNFGLSLGSGVQIPIASRLTLDFNVRDNLGLTSINKSQSSYSVGMKTNTFTISAGLSFKL